MKSLVAVSAVFFCIQSLAQTLTFTQGPSKYAILYADTTGHLYYRKMREKYNLLAVTRDCLSDLERVFVICDWVSKQWKHNGNNLPQKSDPISIIDEAQTGKRFRCVEYAIVVSGTLNAVGIPARILELKTKDAETRKSGAGHVVAEAFVRDLNKWVFIDGQWNLIPFSGQTPLQATELQQSIARRDENLVFKSWEKESYAGKKYQKWIESYLFYFTVFVDNRHANEYAKIEGKSSLMLVPMGEKHPTVFQRKWPLDDLLYTSSLTDFYAPPKKK